VYAFTLIAIWQRLVILNITWNIDVLGKVIRKRRKFTVVGPSAGDRRVVDICLTLITSKTSLTNPSEMSTAGAENGGCHITPFIGFWDFG
jgi:hypothetical protein